MKRIPYVAIIIENGDGEVLLILRDNKSTTTYPNHWTLLGKRVEECETPEMAARRELKEKTGLKMDLSFWKRYDREHPLFIVDQYVYTGKVNTPSTSRVGEDGQALQFFKPCEIEHLKIGYGFDALLQEYLFVHER